ncbi:hypothetical protein BHE74_00058627 [Ensete ventricosum]|nr:hypothetical protein BHE74_00058627 [Ensete ventricosum]
MVAGKPDHEIAARLHLLLVQGIGPDPPGSRTTSRPSAATALLPFVSIARSGRRSLAADAMLDDDITLCESSNGWPQRLHLATSSSPSLPMEMRGK